jgi:repressor LexA
MRNAEGLTQRQERILGYIQDFVGDHGYAPSIRQIQLKLNISSTSVVAYNLKALEGKGLIEREGNISRGIRVPLGAPEPVIDYGFRVPLRGVITAGQPLPDPEDTSESEAETVEVPATLAPPEKLRDVYALKVRGQSMIDALIDDGDIVLIRFQETAENGQMVAVRLSDGQSNGVTLKKFYNEGQRIRLQPANTTMDPIYVEPSQVHIQGRVVGVLRQMF